MKAGRIHHFGPPNAIVIDEIARPVPGKDELVVRVAAAGVGPWDALIRERKSVVQPSLPIVSVQIWRGLLTLWERESFSSSRATRFSASQTNNSVEPMPNTRW